MSESQGESAGPSARGLRAAARTEAQAGVKPVLAQIASRGFLSFFCCA